MHTETVIFFYRKHLLRDSVDGGYKDFYPTNDDIVVRHELGQRRVHYEPQQVLEHEGDNQVAVDGIAQTS